MSASTAVAVDLADAGFGDTYRGGSVPGFTNSDSPYLVPVDPGYQFQDVDAMRILCAAWSREWDRPEHAHRKGVQLFGPTGSGKSSIVEQFFARIGVPLLRVTWNPKREADQLISEKSLIDGMLLDKDQVMVIAARNGWPVLINEIDLADPAELVALNDIIEKGLITLPSGETFVAKRGFCVFATSNTAGIDDEDGVYHGTRSQNASTLRRFFKVRLGYPSEDAEFAFLQEAFPKSSESFLKRVAAIATRLRRAYEGTLDGKRLSKPISRPEVLDWVDLMTRFAHLKNRGINVAEYALGFAFTKGLPDSDSITASLIVAEVFGSEDD